MGVRGKENFCGKVFLPPKIFTCDGPLLLRQPRFCIYLQRKFFLLHSPSPRTQKSLGILYSFSVFFGLLS